jgi:hypothetical protein
MGYLKDELGYNRLGATLRAGRPLAALQFRAVSGLCLLGLCRHRTQFAREHKVRPHGWAQISNTLPEPPWNSIVFCLCFFTFWQFLCFLIFRLITSMSLDVLMQTSISSETHAGHKSLFRTVLHLPLPPSLPSLRWNRQNGARCSTNYTLRV